MTHRIPTVTNNEPRTLIDDAQEPTWDIVIRRYLDSKTNLLEIEDKKGRLAELAMVHMVYSPLAVMMMNRRDMGFEKHKTHLTPNNGRDSLVDAIQEQLDCVVYIQNAILETDNVIFKNLLDDSFHMSLLLLENLYIAWDTKND